MRITVLMAFLPWVLTLAACSSPPKPPEADELRKRPANVAMAVELQSCKNDLNNAQILVQESTRTAAVSNATAVRMGQIAAQAEAAAKPSNVVYAIRFAFGSSKPVLPAADAARLVEDARHAPLVLLRGRTDGASESIGESRIAQERAKAVHTFLTQAGIDAARIRTTWQPIGDHVANNGSEQGRASNRRVEVEIYRVAPQLAELQSAPSM